MKHEEDIVEYVNVTQTGIWDRARATGRYQDWQYEVMNGDTLLGFFDWFAVNEVIDGEDK
jgi:hypothetical protein